MPLKRTILIAVCLGLVGLLAVVVWKAGFVKHPQAPPVAGGDSRTSRQRTAPAGNPVLSALGRLREKPERTASLQTLKEQQAILQSMPRDQALAYIRAFRASGQDHPTGLDFDIGTGGTFSGWPTLRTFLLDAL